MTNIKNNLYQKQLMFTQLNTTEPTPKWDSKRINYCYFDEGFRRVAIVYVCEKFVPDNKARITYSASIHQPGSVDGKRDKPYNKKSHRSTALARYEINPREFVVDCDLLNVTFNEFWKHPSKEKELDFLNSKGLSFKKSESGKSLLEICIRKDMPKAKLFNRKPSSICEENIVKDIISV